MLFQPVLGLVSFPHPRVIFLASHGVLHSQVKYCWPLAVIPNWGKPGKLNMEHNFHCCTLDIHHRLLYDRRTWSFSAFHLLLFLLRKQQCTSFWRRSPRLRESCQLWKLTRPNPVDHQSVYMARYYEETSRQPHCQDDKFPDWTWDYWYTRYRDFWPQFTMPFMFLRLISNSRRLNSWKQLCRFTNRWHRERWTQ